MTEIASFGLMFEPHEICLTTMPLSARWEGAHLAETDRQGKSGWRPRHLSIPTWRPTAQQLHVIERYKLTDGGKAIDISIQRSKASNSRAWPPPKIHGRHSTSGFLIALPSKRPPDLNGSQGKK
jgi:hypothetical protein